MFYRFDLYLLCAAGETYLSHAACNAAACDFCETTAMRLDDLVFFAISSNLVGIDAYICKDVNILNTTNFNLSAN